MSAAIVPVAPTRYVLVHYHIFKNGGSTIESILEREFGEAFTTLHGPSSDCVLDGETLVHFLAGHPAVTAVSSHHLKYPKPSPRNTVLFDCCFLRHPLARLHSEYWHFRRANDADPCCHLARRYSARDYLRRLIEEAPNRVSNVQVNLLSSAGAFTRPADEDDLAAAIAVLRRMAIPGVVRMFDESLVAAEYYLRPAFPDLHLDYTVQNAGRAGLMSDEALAADWGEDLYDQLARLNHLDFDLLRRAREEIGRRLELLPNLAERLAEFKRRCRQRQLPAASMPEPLRVAESFPDAATHAAVAAMAHRG